MIAKARWGIDFFRYVRALAIEYNLDTGADEGGDEDGFTASGETNRPAEGKRDAEP